MDKLEREGLIGLLLGFAGVPNAGERDPYYQDAATKVDEYLDNRRRQAAALPVEEKGARPEARRGIYTASKTRHAGIWKALRATGAPVISTWIDEAGPGESADLSDLWIRCIQESSLAAVVIAYCEDGDILKGGYVEIGAALAYGVPVLAVGLPAGSSLLHHPLVTIVDDLDSAVVLAKQIAASHPKPEEGKAEPSQGEDVGRAGLRDAILKALGDYRCYHTVDDAEGGLPLVDLLSPYSTITEGKDELNRLAEYIADSDHLADALDNETKAL